MSFRLTARAVAPLLIVAPLFVSELMAQATPNGRYTQVVIRYATQINLAADQQAPTSNTPVTLRASLTKTPTPANLGPTGYVAFTVTPQNGPVQTFLETIKSDGTAALTSSFPLGTNNILASYVGDQNYSGTYTQTSITVVQPSTPDFDFTLPTVTIKQGQRYTGNISVQPINGFTGPLSFTVGSLPELVGFQFANPSVEVVKSVTQSSSSIPALGFVITTSATTITTMSSGLFVLGAFCIRRRRWLRATCAFAGLACVSILFVAGCAGKGYLQSNGTPLRTYEIPITGTSGNLIHTHNLTLIVEKNDGN